MDVDIECFVGVKLEVIGLLNCEVLFILLNFEVDFIVLFSMVVVVWMNVLEDIVVFVYFNIKFLVSIRSVSFFVVLVEKSN